MHLYYSDKINYTFSYDITLFMLLFHLPKIKLFSQRRIFFSLHTLFYSVENLSIKSWWRNLHLFVFAAALNMFGDGYCDGMVD